MKTFALVALVGLAGVARFAHAVVTGGSLVKDYPLFEAQFNVRDYGAVGDGTTINTKAFTAAIQAAHDAGGGLVTVDDGAYLVGSISLLSNVYLNVLPNAQVLGSYHVEDYPGPWDDGSVIVGAANAQNVGVVGGGILDGQAVPHFIQYYDRHDDRLNPITWQGVYNCSGECRPRLLQFKNCSNILVRDVTLQNSPDWTSHFHLCANVLVDNITVLGDWRWPNNDGIDPDGTVNMTIRNSYINVADDGICPKTSSADSVLDNLLVEDCIIRSKSCAFKLGSSTSANMTNILAQRLYIFDSNRGLGIQHRDQGHIHNIEFRDIQITTSFQPSRWWGASEPIYITSVARSADPSVVGTVGKVVFRNIAATSENGALISSRTDTPIYDVEFHNVSITIARVTPKRSDIVYSFSSHDYRPSLAPEIVPAPTDAIYFENAQNGLLDGCSFAFQQPRMSDWGICVNQVKSTVSSQGTKCAQGENDQHTQVKAPLVPRLQLVDRD